MGAGREKKDDVIDPTVGIKLNKVVGSRVKKGDLLCTLYVNKEIDEEKVRNIFVIA